MKPNITHQEILLRTDTHFAHRQWADKDSKGSDNLSTIEKLEKACLDGLVKELIPELDITLVPNKKLWLWQVHEIRSFLALDFFEYPGPKQKEASINPYLFLDGLGRN